MYKHSDGTTLYIGNICNYYPNSPSYKARGTIQFRPYDNSDFRKIIFYDSDIKKESNLLEVLNNESSAYVTFLYPASYVGKFPSDVRVHDICLLQETDPITIIEKLNKEQKEIPSFSSFVQGARNNQNKYLNLNKWKVMSNEDKAKEIIQESFATEKNNLDLTFARFLYQYESQIGDKIITSLLCFFIGGETKNNLNLRRRWIRQGHDTLVHDLTETYVKYNKLKTVHFFVLPSCCFEQDRICTASKTKKNNIFCNGFFECRNYSSTRDITNNHKNKVKERKEHVDIRDLLDNIHFEIKDLFVPDTQNKIEDCEYPYRIAAYASRLISISKYLSCRICGEVLYPDLGSNNPSNIYSLVYFTCRNKGHDKEVYINHCCRCGKIIDERECRHQTFELGDAYPSKQWLCMRCGGSDKVEQWKYCPNCLKPLTHAEYAYGAINCKCGHHGDMFGLFPVPEKRKPLEE